MVLLVDYKLKFKGVELFTDGDKRTLPWIKFTFNNGKEYTACVSQIEKEKESEYSDAIPSGEYQTYVEGDEYGNILNTRTIEFLYEDDNIVSLTDISMFSTFYPYPDTAFIPFYICGSESEFNKNRDQLRYEYMLTSKLYQDNFLKCIFTDKRVRVCYF